MPLLFIGIIFYCIAASSSHVTAVEELLGLIFLIIALFDLYYFVAARRFSTSTTIRGHFNNLLQIKTYDSY